MIFSDSALLPLSLLPVAAFSFFFVFSCQDSLELKRISSSQQQKVSRKVLFPVL